MKRITLAVAALAATGLVACGSDDDSSSSTAATTAQAAAPADAYRFVATLDKSSNGDFVAPAKLGIDAAVRQVNDAGGVNGHPIAVEVCQADGSPDTAAACARKVVADPEVLGSVGSFTFGEKGSMPVLEKAGVASIGDYALDAIALESKVSFPTLSVQNGFLNAAALPGGALKAKKVGAVVLDATAGRGAAQQVEQIVKATGGSLARTIFISTTAGDLSAQIQTLKGDGLDAIILILPDQLSAQVIQSYRQVDQKAAIVTTASGLSPEFIDKLGGAADNLYVGLQLSPKAPQEQRFQDAVGKVGDPSKANDISRNSYLGVLMAAKAVDGTAKPTRASVLKALDATSAFDTGGWTPPLDYTKKHGLFPRAALRTGYWGAVKGGKITQISPGPVPSIPESAPGR